MEEAEESEEIRFVKKYLAKHGRLRALKALNNDLGRKKKNDERKPVTLSFAIQKASDRKKENGEGREAKKGSKKAKKVQEKENVSIPKDADQNSNKKNADNVCRKPVSLSFTILKAPKRKIEELAPVKPKKSSVKKAKDVDEEKAVTIPKEFKKLAKTFGLPKEHLDFFYENRTYFNWECKDTTKIHCAEQHCKFTTRATLDCLVSHTISVHNYEDIPCDQVDCSFVAFSSTNLKRHNKRFHGHGRRPTDFGSHNCPYSSCKNSFSRTSQLRRHINVHENNVFLCKYCPFRVADERNLYKHLKVHFDIRNFSCDICSSAFHLPETLVLHKRLVHSTEDFECVDCGFKVPKRSKFLKHRETCAKRLEYSRIL